MYILIGSIIILTERFNDQNEKQRVVLQHPDITHTF